MTGELQSRDKEFALLGALQRKPVTSIGRYQVYTDFSRDDRTTVFILTPSGDEQHKQVLAHAGTHTFIVAAPKRWTFQRKNIAVPLRTSTEGAVFCPGGGFVSIETEGKLRESRASSGSKEFGNWAAIGNAPPGGPVS